MTDHEELKDLVAAYALGALPPDELARVRSHVLTCEACLGEAERYARAVDRLAAAVEPVRLPRGFTEQVVAATVDRTDIGRSSLRVPRRWSALAGLSYLVLVLGLVIGGALLADMNRQLDATQKVAAALIDSADGLSLRGEAGVAKVLPTATGSLFVAVGLEEPPDGRTYQLWLMENDEPVSAGLFGVDEGVAVLESARSLTRFEAAAVTIEPAGGSDAPTTSPILTSV